MLDVLFIELGSFLQIIYIGKINHQKSLTFSNRLINPIYFAHNQRHIVKKNCGKLATFFF